MKKLINVLLLILAILCIAGMYNKLCKYEVYYQTTEEMLNQIYEDNSDYYLDVLMETDEYENYYNAVEALK